MQEPREHARDVRSHALRLADAHSIRASPACRRSVRRSLSLAAGSAPACSSVAAISSRVRGDDLTTDLDTVGGRVVQQRGSMAVGRPARDQIRRLRRGDVRASWIRPSTTASTRATRTWGRTRRARRPTTRIRDRGRRSGGRSSRRQRQPPRAYAARGGSDQLLSSTAAPRSPAACAARSARRRRPRAAWRTTARPPARCDPRGLGPRATSAARCSAVSPTTGVCHHAQGLCPTICPPPLTGGAEDR